MSETALENVNPARPDKTLSLNEQAYVALRHKLITLNRQNFLTIKHHVSQGR